MEQLREPSQKSCFVRRLSAAANDMDVINARMPALWRSVHVLSFIFCCMRRVSLPAGCCNATDSKSKEHMGTGRGAGPRDSLRFLLSARGCAQLALWAGRTPAGVYRLVLWAATRIYLGGGAGKLTSALSGQTVKLSGIPKSRSGVATSHVAWRCHG